MSELQIDSMISMFLSVTLPLSVVIVVAVFLGTRGRKQDGGKS